MDRRKKYADDNAYAALSLWEEFLESDSDPFVVQTYWGEDLQCYFCAGKPDHKPDCIYVRARALIQGE